MPPLNEQTKPRPSASPKPSAMPNAPMGVSSTSPKEEVSSANTTTSDAAKSTPQEEKKTGASGEISSEASGDETSEQTQEQQEETEEETGEDVEVSLVGHKLLGLLTPEGIIMLPLALLLDTVNVVLIFAALDDFWICDAIGMLSVGVWLFLRSGVVQRMSEQVEEKIKEVWGRVQGTPVQAERGLKKQTAEQSAKLMQKAEQVIGKTGKAARWLRPLACFACEIIPYIGVIPGWTIMVYGELTS